MSVTFQHWKAFFNVTKQLQATLLVNSMELKEKRLHMLCEQSLNQIEELRQGEKFIAERRRAGSEIWT